MRHRACSPRRCTSHKVGEAWRFVSDGDRNCPPHALAANECRDSAPLALTPAFQGYDLATRRRLDEALRQLLGNAEQAFPARHLGPDFLGIDVRRYPEHDEIVDEIGAFPDDGV